MVNLAIRMYRGHAAGKEGCTTAEMHGPDREPTNCILGQCNPETGFREPRGVEGPGAEATFVTLADGASVSTEGTTDIPFPQFQIVMIDSLMNAVVRSRTS